MKKSISNQKSSLKVLWLLAESAEDTGKELNDTDLVLKGKRIKNQIAKQLAKKTECK